MDEMIVKCIECEKRFRVENRGDIFPGARNVKSIIARIVNMSII